jgi:hypothetical protein
MENKLTAVDFLKDKFIMIQWLLVRDEISRKQADEFLNEWYDKAKEIEKEQMFEFAEQVLKNTECSFTGLPFMTTGYDNIYEETYGK